MAAIVERPQSQSKTRFGQLSKNMFFARHVAQPRYLKFITGTGGQRICHVREVPLEIPTILNEETSTSLMSDPRFQFEYPVNTYNEALLRFYRDRVQLKRRRERLLPPIPGWMPSGTVVEDTENWRRELARIGEMVGLVTSDELNEIEQQKRSPSTSMAKSRPASGQYSRETGRWNETPKSAQRSRSARRRTANSMSASNQLFCVDEQEREMWMIQVLGQILQTDSVQEIKSWLVSSGAREKEAVRQLITTAIRGLEENGRLESSNNPDDNSKGIQVNMDIFGSLIATRFPQVKAAPQTRENSSKQSSRPRTSVPQKTPQNQVQLESSKKTVVTSPVQARSIDEKKESTPIRKSVSDRPLISSLSQVNRDVQVLTIDDEDKVEKNAQIQAKDQVPF